MTFIPTIITSGLIIIAAVGVVTAYTVYDRHQQGVAQEMRDMTSGGFTSLEDFRRARFMGIVTAKALRDYEERQASIPKRTP